jgi:N-acetylneuraminic acid mutarotase
MRTEVGAARVGRFIYVVGGFKPPFDTTTEVARYDIESNDWDLVAPLPLGVNHPGAVAHRGKLYVHGGFTADGGLASETDALQRFDPATGAWTTLAPSGPARAAETLAAVRGRLYAIGGVDNGIPKTSVEIYDIARNRWRSGPSMKVAREHLASGVLGRRIFVLGGRDGGQNLSVVERLNTRTGRWVTLPSLRVPRSGFQAVAVRGRMIAVGGEELAEGDETIAPVEIYNPRRKRWHFLAPMLTPRHGLGVVSRARRIFAIEGGPQPGLTFSAALEFLALPR